MNSFLLSCRVQHERLAPAPHTFNYPVNTFLIDLAELPELDRKSRLFGYNSFRLTSLLDKDYLTDGDGSIRTKFASLMAANGLDIEERDTVFLVTSPRLLNYVFNPVCFYWVYREDRLIGCVAEVNNTFGEKHVYPLPGNGENGSFPAVYHADKTFHVSPFFDRQGEYEFLFCDIRKQLDVRVTLFREGEKTFEARLSEEGNRTILSDKNLLKTVLTRPFTSHLTFPRILWEAGKIHYGKKIGYNPKPKPISAMTIRHDTQVSMREKVAKKVVCRHLLKMSNGKLTIEMPDQDQIEIGGGGEGVAATIQVHSDSFFDQVLWHDDIGLGETYSKGIWDTPDLANVILFFLANRPVQNNRNPLNAISHKGIGIFQKVMHQIAPRNDEAGSRQNISAHYDLSNDLFSKFLDPTMTYSSALFKDPCSRDENFVAAQKRKNKLLAKKIDINENDHVLEVGCGWGGFAEQTALETGCRVTGVTVSEEQYKYAQKRIREAGLEDRVEIRLQDYRRITEDFDKIVSIEMLEAVGHDFHPEYFRCIDTLLKPSGLAVIQTITIQDSMYDRYRWGMDWIRKHVFPGGLLPSLTRICEVTAKETSLVVQNVDAIGLHYANTLRRWQDTFNGNWEEIAPLGFDEYFKRTWNYYMASCEAGFAYGHINNLQIVLSRVNPDSTHSCCYQSEQSF
ncbi:DUF1365 family protein [Pseudodesulfovibrio sp.]|nr:DUF1365 family protein [Pseudodesulfovibrio sp.]